MAASPESNPFALGLLQLQLMREREKALRECQVEGRDTLEALTSEAKAARKRGTVARKRQREEAAAALPLRRSSRVAGIKLDPESLPADFREPSAADIARGGYEAKYVAPDYDESVVLDDVLDPKQNRDYALGVLDVTRGQLAGLMGLPTPPALAGTSAPPPKASTPAADSEGAPPPSDRLRHYPVAGFLPTGGGFHDARAGEWDVIEEEEEPAGKKKAAASPAKGKAAARAGGGAVDDKWTRRTAGRSPSRLIDLEIRSAKHVMKVVPDRIYTVGFLPCTDKLIAYVGSKDGRLALWTPEALDEGAAAAKAEAKAAKKEAEEEDEGSAAPAAKRARLDSGGTGGGEAAKEEEEEEEEVEEEIDDGLSSTAVFFPHTAPISDVIAPRGAPHLLLTSSYDGSVRALDLNRGVSWGLSHPIEHNRDGLSSMALAGSYTGGGAGAADGPDATGYGFSLFAGAYEGSARHIDTRAPGYEGGPAWQAHDRKVSSVSLVPNSPYLLTASSDATVKIWDVRKLPMQSVTAGSGGSRKGASPHALVTLSSRQAITAACWSPHGRHIAAVCNENVIRIWDATTPLSVLGAPERQPAGGLVEGAEGGGRTIAHDNHTGRWLTTFRCLFDPANDDTLLCGGMTRTLDIFSASTGSVLSEKHQELLTAVPTRNNLHPCPDVDVVVSATASGRVYLWT